MAQCVRKLHILQIAEVIVTTYYMHILLTYIMENKCLIKRMQIYIDIELSF